MSVTSHRSAEETVDLAALARREIGRREPRVTIETRLEPGVTVRANRVRLARVLSHTPATRISRCFLEHRAPGPGRPPSCTTITAPAARGPDRTRVDPRPPG